MAESPCGETEVFLTGLRLILEAIVLLAAKTRIMERLLHNQFHAAQKGQHPAHQWRRQPRPFRKKSRLEIPTGKSIPFR